MGRFSRGGSFIPEERACFLPLDFAVVAGGKAVGGVGFVLGTDVERFGAKIGFWLSSRCRGRGMMTEISLTPQMILRLKSQFGRRVAVQHSALNHTERLLQWQMIQDVSLPRLMPPIPHRSGCW